MYLRDPTDQSPSYLYSDTVDTQTPFNRLLQDVNVTETTANGPDWDLSTCCGKYETIFLCLVPAYLVLIFVLWRTSLLKPMKLIAVFVHEMCHAMACWLTCGTVKEINVNSDEGGVTKYVGGCRLLIIPAGYCGGAFMGGFFVAMSGNKTAAMASAILFCIAMLVSLRFKPNKTMVAVVLFFLALTIVGIVVDILYWPVLNLLTLYYGVFIGAFSVYDIYDDCVKRTVEGSDSHACFKLIPCCLPRLVGLQFGIVALIFQALGLYLALVWMTTSIDYDALNSNEA